VPPYMGERFSKIDALGYKGGVLQIGQILAEWEVNVPL